MRYLVTGCLREPCPLSPAEYLALAIREWETALRWLVDGRALAYGRLGNGTTGMAIVLDVESEAEARRLAESLPLAPYAEMRVRAVEPLARDEPATARPRLDPRAATS